MKKRMKMVIGSAVTIIGLCMPAYAAENITKSGMEEILNDYYYGRYSYITGGASNSVLDASDKVAEENKQRLDGLQEGEKNSGVRYSDVKCNVKITDFEQDETGYHILADEYVTVYYDSDIDTETFKFTTNHNLTVSEDGILEKDQYDECLISYFCNLEEDENLADQEKTNMQEGDIDSEVNGIALAATVSGYNRTAAINYSNTYATGTNSSYGRQTYDCADFVSQCLYAGGLSMNTSGYSTGWYFNFPTKTGSYNWVNVDGFDSYWLGKGIGRSVATISSVIPANPFYWLSSASSDGHGHLMFCTGYNSSGLLVYNAHTTDVQAGLVSTVLGNGKTQYTLKFNTACSTHTPGTVYGHNTTTHWKTCSVCGVKVNQIEHSYITSGSKKTCRYCGYTTSA